MLHQQTLGLMVCVSLLCSPCFADPLTALPYTEFTSTHNITKLPPPGTELPAVALDAVYSEYCRSVSSPDNLIVSCPLFGGKNIKSYFASAKKKLWKGTSATKYQCSSETRERTLSPPSHPGRAEASDSSIKWYYHPTLLSDLQAARPRNSQSCLKEMFRVDRETATRLLEALPQLQQGGPISPLIESIRNAVLPSGTDDVSDLRQSANIFRIPFGSERLATEIISTYLSMLSEAHLIDQSLGACRAIKSPVRYTTG